MTLPFLHVCDTHFCFHFSPSCTVKKKHCGHNLCIQRSILEFTIPQRFLKWKIIQTVTLLLWCPELVSFVFWQYWILLDFFCPSYTSCLLSRFLHVTPSAQNINLNTSRGGLRKKQEGTGPGVVLGAGVVGAGVVVCAQSLERFSTVQFSVQYAEKHQPSPSVWLYIKLSKKLMTEIKRKLKSTQKCSMYNAKLTS